jgi:hypothetical protein
MRLAGTSWRESRVDALGCGEFKKSAKAKQYAVNMSGFPFFRLLPV